ncbi:class I SAM-dependent methyltransferase [Chloroflexota bacterium]
MIILSEHSLKVIEFSKNFVEDIMPFGYIPQKVAWKDIVLRLSGIPSLIRRVQAPVIMRMLGLDRDDIVLDAGCNGGFFTCEIAAECRRSVGIDWNLGGNASIAMSSLSNLSFIRGDVQVLPFADETFHKVLLSSVLQMVEDDGRLLAECHRVLKGNGSLILSVPTDYIYFNGLNRLQDELNHKFGSRGKGFYGQAEVTGLLDGAGFEITDREYSPKKWGSLIYETQLLLCHSLGLPLYSNFYFFLYPLALFDRLGGREQKGCELVIKARKV